MRLWRERVLQAPASRQVRVLVVVLMVLIPALIASALATASAEQRIVRRLTLAVGLAFQGNSDVLLRMTEAQAAWNQTMNGLTLSARYEGAEADVDALLDEVAADLSRDEVGAREQRRYAVLVQNQREAAAEWFEAARAAEQVRHEGPLAARPGRGSGARAVQRLPHRQPGPRRRRPGPAQRGPGAHPRLPCGRSSGSSWSVPCSPCSWSSSAAA